MKLLVVSTWLPDPAGNGSQIRAYQLLRQLSRRHTVTLFAFAVPRPPQNVAPLQTLCARVEVVPPAQLQRDRLSLRGLLSPTPRHFVQTDSGHMRALVATSIGDHEVALGLQATGALYLSGFAKIPRVFEEAEVTVFHERYLRESNRLRQVRHWLTWLKFRRFVRRMANDFGQTTVVSTRERRHLAAIGCDVERVSVVPNGVAVPSVTMPAVRASRLIYAGSITYSANLDAVRYFVREILPLIRRLRPEVVFMVTGATDGVEIDDLANQEGVTFTGQLPVVDDLIAGSAACVVPLRIGGGTRLKVLQAMAVGIPVVSTTKGIEGLEVEPERHVLVGDTPELFARQVLRVLGDPAVGRRLTAEAMQLVRERYDWNSIGDALEAVVGRAVAQHAARRTGSVDAPMAPG